MSLDMELRTKRRKKQKTFIPLIGSQIVKFCVIRCHYWITRSACMSTHNAKNFWTKKMKIVLRMNFFYQLDFHLHWSLKMFSVLNIIYCKLIYIMQSSNINYNKQIQMSYLLSTLNLSLIISDESFIKTFPQRIFPSNLFSIHLKKVGKVTPLNYPFPVMMYVKYKDVWYQSLLKSA